MKSLTKKLTAAALAGLLLAPVLPARAADDDDVADAETAKGSAAAQPNTLTPEEKKAGFKLLFDGKTTEGWRTYKKDKISPGWKVIEGALVRAEGGAGDIVTKDQYDAFELLLDYRISPGGNSGLMFHVTEEGDTPWMTGPEVQIQDNKDGHDPQKSGWLYQFYQPQKDPKTGQPIDATKPAGQWNTMRLVVSLKKSELYMNGVKYYEFVKGSDEWNRLLAKSKFGSMAKFGKPTKGYISLQDHGDEVAVRNIKIRSIEAK
jgi:hypothetical protein